jgi:hypothetical protein
MTGINESTEHWFGLCRKPPLIHASLADMVSLPEPALEGLPDGGGGGSGTVRRGIGAALSGMRTLNRNRQLLWFTLLAGLVLAGNIVGQGAFWYIAYNLHLHPDRIVWQFFIEFATLFCLLFLLAGLFLGIPSKKEGPASFFEGLAGAKKYRRSIFLWSCVLACAGMLLVGIYNYSPHWSPLVLNFFGPFNSFLFGTLSQFPFNLSRLPPADIFTEIPGYGGRSVLLWFYFGFRDTLIFSAINLILFIQTPFVVPRIVLGQKSLREAITGSYALMKKTWVEAAVCAVFLGVIAAGLVLTCPLVQAAHGMVTPLATYYRPTDTWIALGLVYDLALFSAAFVVATIAGIAALDLYRSAESGQMDGVGKPAP